MRRRPLSCSRGRSREYLTGHLLLHGGHSPAAEGVTGEQELADGEQLMIVMGISFSTAVTAYAHPYVESPAIPLPVATLKLDAVGSAQLHKQVRTSGGEGLRRSDATAFGNWDPPLSCSMDLALSSASQYMAL